MDKSDVLLGIIDDRCKKALKEANIPSKIVGTVVKVDSKNKKIDVKIAGYDTVFTLLNKSGEILSEGDNVFVESVKDNLTNGYISERFGEAVWASGASQDLSSYLQKNGDGKDVTVTYTESSSLSNITSGEKLSTMFGKIKKWFTNLKTVAFTGSYNDLIDKPEISTSGTLDTNNSSSLNVPTSPESFGSNIDLHKISKTGSYNDLNNKPTIPTKSSDLTNDAFVRYDSANQNLSNEQKLNARNNIGAGTSNFDGNYNSLTNKPNIPSEYILPVATSTVLGGVKVGDNINIDSDGTISVSDTGKVDDVKVNGNTVVTNKIANVIVPTKLSDLENDNNTVQDSDYIHTDNNFTNEYKNQITNNTNDRHNHNNKELLDTYKQTEVDLSDAVQKKHSHENKNILDNITASYTIDDKNKLDNIENNAEINKINDVKVNGNTVVTNKIAEINMPTKVSELINDGIYTNIVYLSNSSYEDLNEKNKNTIYVVKG